jgi:carbonic anhydrase
MANGQAMDRTDILNAIRDARRKADSFSENESETMSRLKEHQVKEGVAKLEHFSGNQRRMVNQHRTGVVSRHTLSDLLKMRSEHLLTVLDVQ